MSYRAVARVSEVTPRRPTRVELGAGHEPYAIVLVNLEGTVYAMEDRCSHADYRLSDGDVFGGEITCPLHGACFDVRTGQATCGPAYGPVRVYPVRMVGDVIEVDLPE